MDLKSGYPYWAIKNGLMQAFPPLAEDARCDVAVVGAGISGALIADELARHGHEVLVLEQRDVAWGSTAASTALLQYEIDTHLVDLAKQYGEDAAVLAYRACAEAIPALQALSSGVRDVDFQRMQSLYYASRRRDVSGMADEYALRKRHGFDVQWLQGSQLDSEYGIASDGAILSALAARVDPYRLAYRLLARLRRSGAGVHDRTTVDTIDASRRGVTLRTRAGPTVRAGHVVIAAGYASQQWLDQHVARNRSSYAFVTDPIDDDLLGGLRDTMVWESARPYLYLRSTGDGRLVVGGEDDSVDLAARRDRRVEAKSRTLVRKVRKAIPRLELEPAFAWAGTFAETADGLPFVGAHPQYGSRVLFAMNYGGNGITYSMAGAGLLRALVERRKHPLAEIFGFGRLD